MAEISIYVLPAGEGAWRLKARIRQGKVVEERYRRVKGSRIAANRLAEVWKKELGRGAPAPGRMTVAAFVDQYLEEVAAVSLGLAALRDADYVLRRHVVPVIGREELGRLGAEHVDRVLAAGRAAGLGYHSLVKLRAKMSRLFAVAIRRRLMADNPVRLTDPPRDDRPLPTRRIAGTTVDELLAAVRGHWIELPILLAIHAGMRRGEICGLQWGDVDLNAGRVRICRKIADVAGRQAVEAPKRRSFRTVAIAGPVAEALRRHRAEAEKISQVLSARPVEPQDWVFLGRDGGFLRPNSLSHAQVPFFRGVGLPPGIALHALRHTHASEMLEAGVPLQSVSRRLGHARVSTTADFYLHAADEWDERAAAAAGKARGT